MGKAFSLLCGCRRKRRRPSLDTIHLDTLKQGALFKINNGGSRQGQEVLVRLSPDGASLTWLGVQEMHQWGSQVLSTLCPIEPTTGRDMVIKSSRDSSSVLQLECADEASKATFIVSFNAYLRYRKQKLAQESTFHCDDEESPRNSFRKAHINSDLGSGLDSSLATRSPGERRRTMSLASMGADGNKGHEEDEDVMIEVDRLPFFERLKWKRESKAKEDKQKKIQKKAQLTKRTAELPFKVIDVTSPAI